MNIDDAIQNEIEREIENLQDISHRSEEQKHFRFSSIQVNEIGEEVHEFRGQDKKEKQHDNDDQSQGDPVASGGYCFLHVISFSHSITML